MATISMQAHADVLLSRSAHWSRGYRRSDGLQFVLFSGSAGQTYLASAEGCNCRGYLYRGTCAHSEAVRIESERAQAREQARTTTLRLRYEQLFGNDDLEDVH